MQNIFLIKLGGSLITDKNTAFSLKHDLIDRLTQEISNVFSLSNDLFVIGNGGGWTHVISRDYKVYEGNKNGADLQGACLLHNAVVNINAYIIDQLLRRNTPAYSISPSSCMTARKGTITEGYLKPLLILLEHKVVPVVYGDVILDSTKGWIDSSTETIFNFLALKLKERFQVQVIYCGKTNGVYDAFDKPIPRLSRNNWSKFSKQIIGSSDIDVTGGMRHKVQQALLLADEGIKSWIINGSIEGELKSIILNKSSNGTLIS